MMSATQQQMGRWRTAVDLLLVVTLIAALLAWFFDPWQIAREGFRFRISWGTKPLIAIAVLIATRVWISRRAGIAVARPLLPRVALSIGFTLFSLVVLEYAFAWFGVPPGEPVFVVRGASGPAIRNDGSMVSDADLLWRFEPGTLFNGRTVNQLGFLDRPPSTCAGITWPMQPVWRSGNWFLGPVRTPHPSAFPSVGNSRRPGKVRCHQRLPVNPAPVV
jgi:hypothetical protein